MVIPGPCTVSEFEKPDLEAQKPELTPQPQGTDLHRINHQCVTHRKEVRVNPHATDMLGKPYVSRRDRPARTCMYLAYGVY